MWILVVESVGVIVLVVVFRMSLVTYLALPVAVVVVVVVAVVRTSLTKCLALLVVVAVVDGNWMFLVEDWVVSEGVCLTRNCSMMNSTMMRKKPT